MDSTASSAPDDLRLTQAKLARQLRVSRQAIHQHVQSGLLVPDADGLFNIDQARDALRVLHPKGRIDLGAAPASTPSADPPPAPTATPPATKPAAMDYHTARTLLMVNEARLAQLKVQREEKAVLDSTDVHRSLMTAVRELRDLMLAMGRQVAPRVTPMTDEADVREAIDAHVRNMLTNFTDKTLPDLQHRLFGGTGQPAAAAAPADA